MTNREILADKQACAKSLYWSSLLLCIAYTAVVMRCMRLDGLPQHRPTQIQEIYTAYSIVASFECFMHYGGQISFRKLYCVSSVITHKFIRLFRGFMKPWRSTSYHGTAPSLWLPIADPILGRSKQTTDWATLVGILIMARVRQTKYIVVFSPKSLLTDKR